MKVTEEFNPALEFEGLIESRHNTILTTAEEIETRTIIYEKSMKSFRSNPKQVTDLFRGIRILNHDCVTSEMKSDLVEYFTTIAKLLIGDYPREVILEAKNVLKHLENLIK